MKKPCVLVLALFAAVAMFEQAYADCPDIGKICGKMSSGSEAKNVGSFKTGTCWKKWDCEVCKAGDALAEECNSRYSACEGNCAACLASSSTTLGPGNSCWDKTGKGIYLMIVN